MKKKKEAIPMGLFTDSLDPKYKTAEFLASLADAEQRERFVKTLTQMRKDAGLNQDHVAEAMGVRQSTVSQFENGVDPRMSTIQRYARAIGAEVAFVPKTRALKSTHWTADRQVQQKRIDAWQGVFGGDVPNISRVQSNFQVAA